MQQLDERGSPGLAVRTPVHEESRRLLARFISLCTAPASHGMHIETLTYQTTTHGLYVSALH
jgi:hypothetical protein